MLRIPQIHFFPLLPAQLKWPKQKNSCSKMWSIDQLYIELGSTKKEKKEKTATELVEILYKNEKKEKLISTT